MVFRTFFAFWWGSYDVFSRLLKDKTSLSTPAINFWAGGLSAQVFWLTSYPSDVVKQRIMTDPLGPGRTFPRWRDAAKAIWWEQGMRGYWRGFLPCFLRAFPGMSVHEAWLEHATDAASSQCDGPARVRGSHAVLAVAASSLLTWLAFHIPHRMLQQACEVCRSMFKSNLCMHLESLRSIWLQYTGISLHR